MDGALRSAPQLSRRLDETGGYKDWCVRLSGYRRQHVVPVPQAFMPRRDEDIMCPKERDVVLKLMTEGPLVAYLKGMVPIDEDWPAIDDPKPAIESEEVSGTSRRREEDPQDKGC
jgi:hypothetical protein